MVVTNVDVTAGQERTIEDMPYSYFVSYVIVPVNEDTDLRRWGNSVIWTEYMLDCEDNIRMLEQDLAGMEGYRRVCLMFFQQLKLSEVI